MPWRAVYLTLMGLYQQEQGLRRAAHIIHCSLVEKPQSAHKLWPLPFDGESEDQQTHNRLLERHLALNELKQKQQHGSN